MQLKNKHYNEMKKIIFEETSNFVYLGAWVNNKCEEGPKVDFRLTRSNGCDGALQKIIRSKDIS